MSNEAYKLRGKQKESGKWVYGGFYMDETGWYIVTAPDSFVKIEPVTLGRKYCCDGISFFNGDLVLSAFIKKSANIPYDPNDSWAEKYNRIDDLFHPDVGILMRYRSKLQIASNVNSCGWEMKDLRSSRYIKVIGNIFDCPLNYESAGLYVGIKPFTFKGTTYAGDQFIGGYYHDFQAEQDYIIQNREFFPVKYARISVDFPLANGDDSDVEMPEPVYEGDSISITEYENGQPLESETGELVWVDEDGGYSLLSERHGLNDLNFDVVSIRHIIQ